MKTDGFVNSSARAWWIYLLAGLLATGGYFLLPGAGVQDFFYDLIGVVSVGAVVTGIRLNRPERPLPWWLFAAGLSLLTVGNLVWTLYEAFVGGSLAQVSGILYLAGYPVITTGLMLLSWNRSGGWISFIDPAIVATGAGLLSWVFLMEPYATDPSLALADRLFLISYPLLDLLLLAAVARLLMVSGQRLPAYLLLTLGTVCSLVADTSYVPMILTGIDPPGDLVNIGWMLLYVLFGAAALHPSMAASFEVTQEYEERITWRRFALLATASLMIPVALMIEAALGKPAGIPAVAGGAAALFVLVLARMAGLMRLRERTLRRERVLRKFGEALVAAPDRESIYRTLLEAALDLAKPVSGVGAGLAMGSAEQMSVVATAGSHLGSLHGLRVAIEDLPQPVREALLAGESAEFRDFDPVLFWKVLGDFAVDSDIRRRGSIASLLIVPLYVRGELEGAISLSSDAPLPTNARESLEALALNASLALERTVLSEELHQRRSEARFESLVRNASGVIMILNEEGTIGYVSPSCKLILDYEPEDLIGGKALTLIHPEDKLRVRTHFAGISGEHGAGTTLEFRIRHADGSWRYVESVANNLLDDPDVRGVVINCRDVTQRKKSEEALKEAELRYRTLVERMPAVTYTNPLDETGHSVYISPRIEDMLGYSVEEGREDPGLWDRILHPEDRERVLAEEARTSATGDPFRMEYRMIHRDGRIAWVRDEAVLVRDDEGRPRFWQGVMLDITGRKEAEERLKEAEQKYRTLIEEVPAITYAHVQDAGELSTTSYISPQVETVLGYTPEECVGNPEFWKAILHPEDRERVLEEDARTGETGEPFRMEFRVIAKNGETVWLREEGRLLHDEAGQHQTWHGVMFDITELKRVEEDLRKAEAKHRSLIENIPAVTYTQPVGATDVLSYMSPQIESLLGYTPEEYIAKPGFWMERLHPDDRKRVLAEDERTNETLEPYSIEYRVRSREGRYVWVREEAVVVYDEQGAPRYWQGFLWDITNRKEIEEKLRSSEAELRALFEAMTDVILVLDGEGRYHRVTSNDPSLLYSQPDERVGKTLHEVLPEEKADLFLDSVRRALDTRQTVHVEYSLKTGGEQKWFSAAVSPMLGDRCVWVARDITARKKAEEALRESEASLAEAQRIAHIGNWEWDVTSGEVHWSDEVFRIYGYSPGEFIPTLDKLMEIIHPEDRELIEERMHEALYEGETYDVTHRIVLPDGTVRVVHRQAEVLFDENGQPLRMIGTVHDITERKRAEEALQESEAKYRALVERVPSVTYREKINTPGVEPYVSPRVETLLGYSSEEFLKDLKLWESLIHPEDRELFRAADERASETEEPLEAEYRMISKDGDVVWVHDEAIPVRDEEGRILYWQGVVTDITDRRRAEKALREAENRYRTLVETVPPIVYVQYPNDELASYDVTYMSPRVEQVLGYRPQDFIEDQEFWDSLIHPEDLPLVRAEDERTDRTGEPFSMQYRMYRRDGSLVWIQDEAILIHNEEGEPLYWQGVMTDITAQKKLEEQLAHQAFHDELTGLPNRALFMDRLKHALARTERRERSLAVLFVDLDNFKFVNDSFGHEAGDALLVETARRLEKCIRPEDTAARLGGDEFTVLLEDLGDVTDAAQVARRILEEPQAPFFLEGKEVNTTVSIGIAVSSSDHQSPSDLLRDADTALYRAKARGKDGYVVFDEVMNRHAEQLLKLEADLRRAVERGELAIHYQPTLELSTSQIAGWEAVACWQHPLRGFISSQEFEPIAEGTGLITTIGNYVLREACLQLKDWQTRLPSGPGYMMSVNLSAKQLQRPEIVEEVRRVLRESELEPNSLVLEISESGAIEDHDSNIHILRKLKELGVQIALDDFGTGYASLARLRSFPVDILKLEKSFVDGLGENAADATIAETVIRLAHALNLKTVAEGIETEKQAAALRALGCELGQGPYFAEPLPASELERTLNLRSAAKPRTLS